VEGLRSGKTEQTYEMNATEKEKPGFRVGIVNRVEILSKKEAKSERSSSPRRPEARRRVGSAIPTQLREERVRLGARHSVTVHSSNTPSQQGHGLPNISHTSIVIDTQKFDYVRPSTYICMCWTSENLSPATIAGRSRIDFEAVKLATTNELPPLEFER
jgi:hypothetical protein